MIIRISGDAFVGIVIFLAGGAASVAVSWLINKIGKRMHAKQLEKWRKEDEAFLRELDEAWERIWAMDLSEERGESDRPANEQSPDPLG